MEKITGIDFFFTNSLFISFVKAYPASVLRYTGFSSHIAERYKGVASKSDNKSSNLVDLLVDEQEIDLIFQ